MEKEKPLGLATVAEAKQFLGVSRSTLYRMLSEKELRSLKVRGGRRIRWADLLSLINANERCCS